MKPSLTRRCFLVSSIIVLSILTTTSIVTAQTDEWRPGDGITFRIHYYEINEYEGNESVLSYDEDVPMIVPDTFEDPITACSRPFFRVAMDQYGYYGVYHGRPEIVLKEAADPPWLGVISWVVEYPINLGIWWPLFMEPDWEVVNNQLKLSALSNDTDVGFYDFNFGQQVDEELQEFLSNITGFSIMGENTLAGAREQLTNTTRSWNVDLDLSEVARPHQTSATVYEVYNSRFTLSYSPQGILSMFSSYTTMKHETTNTTVQFEVSLLTKAESPLLPEWLTLPLTFTGGLVLGVLVVMCVRRRH